MVEIIDKNVFNIMTLPNNLVLVCRFKKTILLCSVHCIQFVKDVFYTKICFMKTSTRIVKYESQVIELNPDSTCITHYLKM